MSSERYKPEEPAVGSSLFLGDGVEEEPMFPLRITFQEKKNKRKI